MSVLRENPTFGGDVTFKCKNNKIIRGHSSVLAASSSVFAEMFQNESKEKEEKVVEIKDIAPKIFEQLIQYLYIKDVDLENNIQSVELQKADVTELLIAADKYRVDPLKERCAQYLAENVTVQNATKYLVWADNYKVPELYEFAMIFM